MKLLTWMYLVLTKCALSQSDSSISQFSVISTSGCLNESMSVWQKPQPASSMINCFTYSQRMKLHSVGVVQWNTRAAGSCTLFRYQQVCQQLLDFINSTPSAAQDNCKIVVDSDYDVIAANNNFAAVWIGVRGSEMENVVCTQRNVMKSSGVTWTSEGAVMDGVTSRLWVDDPVGLDFTNGYTWVLHLKRTPKANCFVELSSCDFSAYKDNFWEFSYDSGVSRAMYLYPGEGQYYQTGSVMPADSEKFFIAGVTYNRTAKLCRFFSGGSFQSDQFTGGHGGDFTQVDACVKVGWRYPNSGLLNGVIKAVAFANSALSEDAIRRLFVNHV